MPSLSMRKRMSQITIEGLYPLLIIGAGALIRLLKKKANEQKKEWGALPPSPSPTSPIRAGAPPRKSPQLVLHPPSVQRKINPSTAFRRRRPRIAKLIVGMKQKQILILLSEILVNKHHIK